MNIQELAQNIVREFVLGQISDSDSEFWDAVETDPDVLDLTEDEYSLLLKAIQDVKVTVH